MDKLDNEMKVLNKGDQNPLSSVTNFKDIK